MSDLARAFDHGKAFIAFLTCGDPDLETTAAAVPAAVQNGADLIELGIPFSDPTAEGPVIQAANLRALQSGTTTDKIFDLVRELRRDVTIPMVFMTYANVVFSYGTDRFLSNCRDAGIDGLILPDVPYEEKEEFLPACRKYGVEFVSLIAPTSENRIAMIAREAEGFLYIVSSLGVTGERSEIKTDLASIVALVQQSRLCTKVRVPTVPSGLPETGEMTCRCDRSFSPLVYGMSDMSGIFGGYPSPVFTVHTVHYRTPSHRSERLLPSLVRWAT